MVTPIKRYLKSLLWIIVKLKPVLGSVLRKTLWLKDYIEKFDDWTDPIFLKLSTRDLSTLDLNSDDKSTKGNLSINLKNSLLQSVVNFSIFSAELQPRAFEINHWLKFLRLRIVLWCTPYSFTDGHYRHHCRCRKIKTDNYFNNLSK